MRFDVIDNSNYDVCCSYDSVEDVLDQLDIYEEEFCENLEDDSCESLIEDTIIRDNKTGKVYDYKDFRLKFKAKRFDVIDSSKNVVCYSYDSVEEVLHQLYIYEEYFCENLEDDSCVNLIKGTIIRDNETGKVYEYEDFRLKFKANK